MESLSYKVITPKDPLMKGHAIIVPKTNAKNLIEKTYKDTREFFQILGEKKQEMYKNGDMITLYFEQSNTIKTELNLIPLNTHNAFKLKKRIEEDFDLLNCRLDEFLRSEKLKDSSAYIMFGMQADYVYYCRGITFPVSYLRNCVRHILSKK